MAGPQHVLIEPLTGGEAAHYSNRCRGKCFALVSLFSGFGFAVLRSCGVGQHLAAQETAITLDLQRAPALHGSQLIRASQPSHARQPTQTMQMVWAMPAPVQTVSQGLRHAVVPRLPPTSRSIKLEIARAASLFGIATSTDASLNKLKIEDVDVSGQRVFIRVDFNVPQDKKNSSIITSTQRIDVALPTIIAVLEKGAKSVVLASHLGRPDGRIQEKYSMAPVAKVLEEKLGRRVTFLKACSGPEVEAACADPARGSVILLENLRFNLEEEGKGKDAEGNKVTANPKQVKEFRNSMSKLADIYVNDAFSAAHRPHSSILGEGYDIKATGGLMSRELDAFAKVLDVAATPVLAILGGAKVTDKIQLIFNMLDKVNKLIIGGGMAFTFLKVTDGMAIGSSLYDEEGAKVVPKIMAKARESGVDIILPVDFTVSSKFGEDGEIRDVTKEEGIPEGFMGLDCGPQSTELFKAAINASKTIIWNGPMGVFEMGRFETGTKALMEAVSAATERGAVSVIGGGDTASACERYNTISNVTHCSSGGDASVGILEGRPLPGIATLSNAR